jgi:hypothetical protein
MIISIIHVLFVIVLFLFLLFAVKKRRIHCSYCEEDITGVKSHTCWGLEEAVKKEISRRAESGE